MKLKFDLDIGRMVIWLMPSFLRKEAVNAWLQSLVLPVKMLYGDFRNKREAYAYKLAHNGQVCYLRKVLNDEFDPSERRIELVDGNSFKRLYLYSSVEGRPVYLRTSYINRAVDYEDTGVDFMLILPRELDVE